MRSFLIGCVAGSFLIASCGGGGSKTVAPVITSPCVTGTLVPLKTPTIVTVSGAGVSGTDIDVGAPQSCPAINAEVLGVADVGATTATASDIGGQVHRGDTKIVLLFGPGLSGAMTVSVAGQPNDFIISNVHSITAKDNTPGVQFNVTVSPSAAFGARTVTLRAANDDLSVFAGGLEVIP